MSLSHRSTRPLVLIGALALTAALAGCNRNANNTPADGPAGRTDTTPATQAPTTSQTPPMTSTPMPPDLPASPASMPASPVGY